MSQTQSNPWKAVTIALIASIASALAAGVIVARAHDGESEERVELESTAELAATEEAVDEMAGPEVVAVPEPQPSAAPVAAAPPRTLENCERYRYKTRTDGGRVVKNGLLGGALGAGFGAAGGAIGGSAGKGAGIGALAGAVVGTGYTLHDEHRQKQASRDAYHACLARNRY